MYRGTTPRLIFNMPFDVTQISVLWITFKQGAKIQLEKTLEDCGLNADKNQIFVTLTQAETLSFTANKDMIIQLRVKFINDKAGVSKEIDTYVYDILHDGEI